MLRQSERTKVEKLLDHPQLNITWADVKERLEECDLVEIIPQFHGVICGDDRFTQRVYEHASNLEVIVKWGTGIDSLNKFIADSKNIKLYRTPGAFTFPVADTTLAYMLNFLRGVRENTELMKNGNWDKPQGYCLFEKTVGIIGFGEIGRAVAKRLRAFDAKVLAYDTQDFSNEVYIEYNVERCDLDTILKESDIITIHTDLNDSSFHLINKETIERMERQPFLINTCRGPVIKEKDLIEALQNKKISGAGLDVFEEEPLPLDSPLRKMNNVLLASHNSNSSPKCWENVHKNSVKMLLEGLGL